MRGAEGKDREDASMSQVTRSMHIGNCTAPTSERPRSWQHDNIHKYRADCRGLTYSWCRRLNERTEWTAVSLYSRREYRETAVHSVRSFSRRHQLYVRPRFPVTDFTTFNQVFLGVLRPRFRKGPRTLFCRDPSFSTQLRFSPKITAVVG